MPYSIDHISKSYGSRTVIRDLSFSFPDHGLCVVTGPSGSGKTTLLRLLAGLELPDTGFAALPGHKAMSFQEYRLFPQLTALQNAVALCPNDQKQVCEREARRMLTAFSFREDQLHLLPSQCSGGMKQRISLVRALCGNGALILLDEPFKELDTTLKHTVLTSIMQKSQSALIIITAHDLTMTHELASAVLRLG